MILDVVWWIAALSFSVHRIYWDEHTQRLIVFVYLKGWLMIGCHCAPPCSNAPASETKRKLNEFINILSRIHTYSLPQKCGSWVFLAWPFKNAQVYLFLISVLHVFNRIAPLQAICRTFIVTRNGIRPPEPQAFCFVMKVGNKEIKKKRRKWHLNMHCSWSSDQIVKLWCRSRICYYWCWHNVELIL